MESLGYETQLPESESDDDDGSDSDDEVESHESENADNGGSGSDDEEVDGGDDDEEEVDGSDKDGEEVDGSDKGGEEVDGSDKDGEEIDGCHKDGEEVDGATLIMKKSTEGTLMDVEHDRSGDAESGEGGEGSEDRGKVHVCTAWFRVLLKWAVSLLGFRVEKDWVEIMADKILVNETLIDNRLSDVHTVCNFRVFSREERKKMKRAKSRFVQLWFRFRYGFANALRGMRILFSLTFLRHPRFSNAASGPRLFRSTPNLFG